MSAPYHESSLDAALFYADLGWHVFPTEGSTNPTKAKHPATREVARWSNDSTTDRQQIAAWFSGTGYGIGVDCGKSGIVALDADRPNLIPEVSLTEAWSLRGNPERRSFIFDQPTDQEIHCARGRWMAGEVKGIGGYVCLPPSYHAIGGHYVWTNTSGSRKMPDDVKSLLRASDEAPSEVAEYATQGIMCAAVERALDKRISLLVHLDVGRYPQMLGGMYELAALGAEGHEGTLEALLILRETYVASVSDRSAAAEARAEWDRAARGLSKGVRHSQSVRCLGPRCESNDVREASTPVLGVSDLTSEEYEQRVVKRVSQLRVDVEARKRLRLENAELWTAPQATSLLSLAIESAMPDRVSGLLNANGTVLIVAQRKTGKTTLIGNLVRSFCDGVDLFERYRTSEEIGKVGLFDLEMTPAMLGEWLARLNIVNLNRLNVYSVRGRIGETFSVLSEEPKRFGEWLRSEGITTLIIDPLAPLLVSLGIDEADNSGVRKFLTMLRDIATEAGIGELVLSHHSGWHDSARSRGASSFEDAPDVIWRLRREGVHRLFSVIGRTQEMEECPLMLKESGDLYLDPNEIHFGDF